MGLRRAAMVMAVIPAGLIEPVWLFINASAPLFDRGEYKQPCTANADNGINNRVDISVSYRALRYASTDTSWLWQVVDKVQIVRMCRL